MAPHSLTCGGWEYELSLQAKPSRFSFTAVDRREIKDSTSSLLVPLRVEVPQKSRRMLSPALHRGCADG